MYTKLRQSLLWWTSAGLGPVLQALLLSWSPAGSFPPVSCVDVTLPLFQALAVTSLYYLDQFSLTGARAPFILKQVPSWMASFHPCVNYNWSMIWIIGNQELNYVVPVLLLQPLTCIVSHKRHPTYCSKAREPGEVWPGRVSGTFSPPAGEDIRLCSLLLAY